MDPPVWWDWELDLPAHIWDRMTDRGFSETDLRDMMNSADDWRPSHTFGRFVLETTHDSRPWEVVVEPDELAGLLVVVTAYPVT